MNDRPQQRRSAKDTVSAGRVEMCLDTEFQSICDNNWNNAEASVVCSELGFSKFGMSVETGVLCLGIANAMG